MLTCCALISQFRQGNKRKKKKNTLAVRGVSLVSNPQFLLNKFHLLPCVKTLESKTPQPNYLDRKLCNSVACEHFLQGITFEAWEVFEYDSIIHPPNKIRDCLEIHPVFSQSYKDRSSPAFVKNGELVVGKQKLQAMWLLLTSCNQYTGQLTCLGDIKPKRRWYMIPPLLPLTCSPCRWLSPCRCLFLREMLSQFRLLHICFSQRSVSCSMLCFLR